MNKKCWSFYFPKTGHTQFQRPLWFLHCPCFTVGISTLSIISERWDEVGKHNCFMGKIYLGSSDIFFLRSFPMNLRIFVYLSEIPIPSGHHTSELDISPYFGTIIHDLNMRHGPLPCLTPGSFYKSFSIRWETLSSSVAPHLRKGYNVVPTCSNNNKPSPKFSIFRGGIDDSHSIGGLLLF